MKQSDFQRYLRQHGCVLGREGGNHAIWKNTLNGKTAAVPRHPDVAWGTVKGICKKLEIDPPASR